MKFPAWSRAVYAVGSGIMQRWIIAGVVALALFCGGGYAAIKVYKQNRPAPVWVPLPINPELPVERRDEIVAKLKEGLSEKERLVVVSKDVGLIGKWGMSSNEEGAEEIASRLFVREGEADTPQGRVPAIHIGIKGKRKETKVSGEITVRLMKDVFEILGIERPDKMPD
jgi:hypothetical protein